MLEFPPGFTWGVATASYQIEGSTGVDGRGESIWDRFSHTPGRVHGGDTGDVACDHYRRYRQDVELMARLGIPAYRFSVAWPRVVPDGSGPVNEAGLAFYDRLVDALLDAGIEPHLTLYHWDLPQPLEDAGGWPVRDTAQRFADYATLVARRLGDRLATLATLNEPWCSANLGYRNGLHAPGRSDPDAANAAAHHLLVGHGLALRAIRAEAPGVRAGIVLNFDATEPRSAHLLDVEEAALAIEGLNAWFLDPIVGREYPVAGGRAHGWDGSGIQPGDRELIAAPIDFLGINYYTGHRVGSIALADVPPPPAEAVTDMGWAVRPAGLTTVLQFVQSRTGDLPLYIMENGAAYPADPADPARDPERVRYLEAHVAAAHRAIELGVPLRGYFAWSFLDNFEWSEGYRRRFGLVHVDYETQERIVRDSGRYWASLAAAGREAASTAPR